MIVIIDYGISNIGAVKNALEFLKIKSIISSSKDEINGAEKIIIPGNGNFGEGIRLLKTTGIYNVLNDLVLDKKVPILGICLGYQLMFKESEEDNNFRGFGWIEGKVKKFKEKKKFPVPHVGWNSISFKDISVMKDIPSNSRFYFDHSYYPMVSDFEYLSGSTKYSTKFPSIFQKDNIIGCQPHLEKSQKYGLVMLKNFCETC
jgi:glutamine amidotransferase